MGLDWAWGWDKSFSLFVVFGFCAGPATTPTQSVAGSVVASGDTALSILLVSGPGESTVPASEEEEEDEEDEEEENRR